MVCKPTSTTRTRGTAGFTIIELMLAMSIGVMVLAAGLVLWAYATRTCATLLNYVELSNASKMTMDGMSQEIRNATVVQSCQSNQLMVLDPDGIRITYTYDPNAKTLTQVKSNATTTLLTECSSFQFDYYQRVPTNGTYDLIATTSTNTTKVVQMQWTCGRRLTGDTTNMETQRTGRVVIRSK